MMQLHQIRESGRQVVVSRRGTDQAPSSRGARHPEERSAASGP